MSGEHLVLGLSLNQNMDVWVMYGFPLQFSFIVK